ncbi:MAG: hypothetical protein Kow0037_31270 [Calditrichia bacterium]
MEEFWTTILDGYIGYANYLWGELLHPSFHSYLWSLILISLFVWALEIFRPWRKNQPIIREDFWLDGFYMFFNFFIFSLLIFNAASLLSEKMLMKSLALFGITRLDVVNLSGLPHYLQLFIYFVARDFIHWNIHRLLHRNDRLWQFHKVHHSVKQMGFAAHLRFHWMENAVYRTLEYLPMSLLGFSVSDFFLVHIIALTIGHLNHANFRYPLGSLKYILNNPEMHIWHHARHLPPDRPYGVNYGISLSIWDYLFGQAYIPSDGRDIELGFPDLEKFPGDFIHQLIFGFKEK